MPAPQITTIGSATVDILFYTDEGDVIRNPHKDPTRKKLLAFELGAKLEGSNMLLTYGGAATNSAVTFSRLGLHVQCLTAVGADVLGLTCINNLKKNGVETQMVQKIANEPTAVSFIVNSGIKKFHSIFVYRGATQQLTLNTRTLRAVKTPWIYLSAMSGNWKPSLKALFAHAHAKKIRVAWNPGTAQIAAGLQALKPHLHRAEVLIVNQDEAIELLLRQNRNAGRFTPSRLAQTLYVGGPKKVLVTCGHRGAYLYNGITTIYQPAIIKKTLNKTGAGDAFGSGFIAGLVILKNTKTALRIGALNSSSVVQHLGAQEGILHMRDLKKLI